MIEVYGDFWKFNADFYCITTNGNIKNNFYAVMGAGIAKQARDKFPGIDFDLGFSIKEHGNHTVIIPQDNWKWDKIIIAFPTKHNWWEKSDIKLIEKSAHELEKLAFIFKHQKFVLTWPGIGNGGLEKEKVRDIISGILSDNVYVIEIK